MKKKLVSLLLATVMGLALTSCGNRPAETTAPADTEAASEEVTTEAPAEEAEATTEAEAEMGDTIKIAALESAYGPDVWKKVTEAFTAKTGIKVDLVIDKEIEDKITPGLQAGDFPDVVYLAQGREKGLTENFIKENALYDLSEALDMNIPGEDVTARSKITDGFLSTNVTNPYSDGKTYLAPILYSPTGLFYNVALFEEKGWEVPTTWDEMFALGDKAKEEGIALFAYPTTGYFDGFLYAMMHVAGGPEFFNKVTHFDVAAWDSEEGKALFDVFDKLLTQYTDKTVPANANKQGYLTNQALVVDGKALFMPNGTWVAGEMADAVKNYTKDGAKFQWGLAPIPALKEGGDRYSYSYFEQIWIPAEAKNKEGANKFVSYLYSDEAIKIFIEANAVQPVKGVANMLEGDNQAFYSIYESVAKVALGGFAATNPVEGLTISDVFFAPIDSVVSGDKTAADWADGIKKASETFHANLK